MSLHRELPFEDEVCDHLARQGWLYAKGDAAQYDRARALFPADVLAWVQETQPEAWDQLTKQHGSRAGEALVQRLAEQLDHRGTLEVLRHGLELLGVRKPVLLAQFKPALGINPTISARYTANRLRVVRQVRYSVANENAIDLVLFLNGLPVATVELKSDFTQSLTDAIDQYRFDRLPQPKGQGPEPLLSFPRGALVHFAVSHQEAAMVTKLEGPSTRFLPFNQGDGDGAGNPVRDSGPRTAYLWEEVWERESWLDILGRYLIPKRDAKKQLTGIIFPRFHQLDVTRKLQAAILAQVEAGQTEPVPLNRAADKGQGYQAVPPSSGGTYLVQHSAGSGKTNSIAWTAHFLADLHDRNHTKVFHSVVVISDRTVIDDQLQDALFSFQRQTGVVATITGDGGSKSAELAEALSGNKKIVVCTIQTFPYALAEVRRLAATEGKRFAVIADEAHSSQTGEAAAKLKNLLSPEELAELSDGGEVSTEDILAAQMAARAGERDITFVAFTATPKGKTLELFGQRPNPAEPAGPNNLPQPFHVYSMRQAIEEGFILDVLENYTPYKLAFKLTQMVPGGQAEVTEEEVERSRAMKHLMGWVRLHPYNIAQKVQIVVEHYRAKVAPLLNGKAKAMVVVGSRVEAVRWQLAIRKYIADKGYPISTLVAFSGEVKDSQSTAEPVTEHSPTLNPGLKGDIRDAFAGPEFHILLVANKYQTGFDQPLLCGMYVDKRLAGIQAVQTLSRLNRAYPGKKTTYILDFMDNADEVLKAFKQYYTTAELAGATDPNLIFTLKAKLDASGHYDTNEVERVVTVQLNPKAHQSDLIKAIDPVADRLLRSFKAARVTEQTSPDDPKARKEAKDAVAALVLFKQDLTTYLRAYAFLSQVFDYGATSVEKLAIFAKVLVPLLDFGREREGVDLSKVVLTHHNLKDLGTKRLALDTTDKPLLPPMTELGTGEIQEKQKALLRELIEKVNELFAGELSDDDKLIYVNNVIKGKLLESELLVQQAANNSKEQFGASPDLNIEITNAIMASLDAHTTMSTQALNSLTLQASMKDFLLNYAGLWEALRARAGSGARL